MKKLTTKEKKIKAQDLIMQHLSIIGYSKDYTDFVNEIGDHEEAEKILFKEMCRAAKIYGYHNAWFS